MVFREVAERGAGGPAMLSGLINIKLFTIIS
jgi:hypothetical protein